MRPEVKWLEVQAGDPLADIRAFLSNPQKSRARVLVDGLTDARVLVDGLTDEELQHIDDAFSDKPDADGLISLESSHLISFTRKTGFKPMR